MMKVAYTGWTWIGGTKPYPELAKQALEQSFKECKYLGYDYVENFAFIRDYYADDPQELVALAQRCGVELVNLYGHFTFDVESSLATAMAQVKFLADIGGKWYNCQHGGGNYRIDGAFCKDDLDKICEIANRLGKYAKTLGVTVCFHPHFGTCVFTQEQIDYFAQHTDPQYVSFCLDTAHTTLAGIDPVALVHQYGKRIDFMHLKDVDTYALSKAEGRDKMRSFRALGLGTVDFPAVYAALQEEGYDGFLCVELDRPAICNYNSAEVSRKYIKNALGL